MPPTEVQVSVAEALKSYRAAMRTNKDLWAQVERLQRQTDEVERLALEARTRLDLAHEVLQRAILQEAEDEL